jgi:hypothetical protein
MQIASIRSMSEKDRLNALTQNIIGSAIAVHHERGYRLDLLVEGLIVVEVKAVERFERVHSAQLLSYLRFAKCKVGLLFNFNVKWPVQDGVKRIVNGFPG